MAPESSPLRDRLRALLDEEYERDDGTHFGILYREAGKKSFAWSGLAPPIAMLDMMATLVAVAVNVAHETGMDEDEVRAVLARIAMGQCPQCGAPIHECSVH